MKRQLLKRWWFV